MLPWPFTKHVPIGSLTFTTPTHRQGNGRGEQLNNSLKNTKNTQDIAGINCLVICMT